MESSIRAFGSVKNLWKIVCVQQHKNVEKQLEASEMNTSSCLV